MEKSLFKQKVEEYIQLYGEANSLLKSAVDINKLSNAVLELALLLDDENVSSDKLQDQVKIVMRLIPNLGFAESLIVRVVQAAPTTLNIPYDDEIRDQQVMFKLQRELKTLEEASRINKDSAVYLPRS